LKPVIHNESTPQISNDAVPAGESVSTIKRTLLKASWIPPVIVAAGLPRSGYAANVSGSSKPQTEHDDNGNHFGQFK
jgi:hypothetical protein